MNPKFLSYWYFHKETNTMGKKKVVKKKVKKNAPPSAKNAYSKVMV